MEPKTEQDRIRDLLKSNLKGLTIEEVSTRLSISRATAAKYLNSLVLTGQADMRNLGSAKLFYLTQRLPLKNLLSLSSDLILILDEDLFIQEVNDPFLSFFHLKKEDLKDRRIEQSPLANYFSEEHLSPIRDALGGTELSRDAQFDTGAGMRFYRMKFLPLVFEGGGRAVGIILEDITEMKKYQFELEERVSERTESLVRTNEALHENEQKFRDIFNNANDMIQIVETSEEGLPGKCIEVNDVMLRMLQFTREELLARDPSSITTAYHNKPREEVGREILAKGHATFETGFVRKDGSVIPVEINVHLAKMLVLPLPSRLRGTFPRGNEPMIFCGGRQNSSCSSTASPGTISSTSSTILRDISES